ncbi:10729_t:CDS:2, partial [Diversispora eburnea]
MEIISGQCEQENPSLAQANLSIKEKLLKNIFVTGLNPKNQLVAEECGKYLLLEGLDCASKSETGSSDLEN